MAQSKNQQEKKPLPATRSATTPATRPSNSALAKYDYGGLGPRAGLEGADREAFAIPFLQILQKLSPQLDRNNPGYIKTATEGMILNTANGEVYDGEEGILVMPVEYKRSFTAWTIREKGGGYKGEYAPGDPIIMTTKKDIKNRDMLPDNATQLSDTRLHGVILLTGDTPQPALISLTSTGIKKSKRWMTQMQERQKEDGLPTFAHVYRLTTVPERNDQGNWMGWKIEPAGDVADQDHVDAAVAFFRALQTGARVMRADTASQE